MDFRPPSKIHGPVIAVFVAALALACCSDSDDPFKDVKRKCAEYVRRSLITKSEGLRCHLEKPVFVKAARASSNYETKSFFRIVRRANRLLNEHATRVVTASYRPLPRDRKIGISFIKGAALKDDWRFSVKLKQVSLLRPDCQQSCSGWSIHGVRQDTGSKVLFSITGIPETFLEAHWWCHIVLSDNQDGCTATAFIDKFESPLICSMGQEGCIGSVKVMALKVELPSTAKASAAIFETHMKLWRKP